MKKRGLKQVFKGDRVIWMVFFFLCVISVVEVFSASSALTYKSGSYLSPVLKHVGILCLGLFCMIVTLNIKCKYFKFITAFLILLSYVLLLCALFGGVSLNDGHRWLSLFGLQFQPSEIAKGTMILATAQLLAATQTEHGASRSCLKWIAIVCVPMILLIAPENLSTALLISITLFMMMYIGRIPKGQLIALCGVAVSLVVAVVVLVFVVGGMRSDEEIATGEEGAPLVAYDDNGSSPRRETTADKIFHRASVWRSRLLDFGSHEETTPSEVDLEGKGAQRAFSYIAIASSHITGVGPGKSEERDFLSQAFSDFIYAIIIEELGLLGAIGVVLLYIILLYRTGRIANRCANNFPAFLAMGLALMLVTQALFNMCVAVGLAPITGQPLPLISKGGTSTVINCIYIGAILSISYSAQRVEALPADDNKMLAATHGDDDE